MKLNVTFHNFLYNNNVMKKISKATLQRYPLYLKALRKLRNDGVDKIMSSELANYVDVKSTTIRRDFSLIGSLGKQGYGYDVDKLIEMFTRELGGDYSEKMILVGCGNLGKAIANYGHWNELVGDIVCAFDKIPENVAGVRIPVYNINEIEERIPKGCRIAILAASKDVQETVNRLASVGIKGIVDITHQHFKVPNGVKVKEVDIVSTIQELVFQTNMLDR